MSKKHRHPAIRVASARNGFRRGGHEFGVKSKTIPLGELHPDAYAAITGDQSLVVCHTAIELDEAQAAALPHADASHVIEALSNASSLTLSVSDDDAKRVLALDEREADLRAREEALSVSAEDIAREKAALAERIAEFEREEAVLAEKIASFDHEKAAFEAHVAQSKTGTKK